MMVTATISFQVPLSQNSGLLCPSWSLSVAGRVSMMDQFATT